MANTQEIKETLAAEFTDKQMMGLAVMTDEPYPQGLEKRLEFLTKLEKGMLEERVIIARKQRDPGRENIVLAFLKGRPRPEFVCWLEDALNGATYLGRYFVDLDAALDEFNKRQ